MLTYLNEILFIILWIILAIVLSDCAPQESGSPTVIVTPASSPTPAPTPFPEHISLCGENIQMGFGTWEIIYYSGDVGHMEPGVIYQGEDGCQFHLVDGFPVEYYPRRR